MCSKPFLLKLSLVFMLLPCVVKGQSSAFEKMQKNIVEYEEEYMKPTFLAQRKKVNPYLSEAHAQKLFNLAQRYQMNLASQKKLKEIKDKSVYMTQWEQLQVERVKVLSEARGIADEYHQILEQVMRFELKNQRLQWRRDLQKIIDDFNSQHRAPDLAQFAKYGFGKYSEKALFLLWEAESPEEEAAAEGGSQ